LAVELDSCRIPFSFDDIRCYAKIFNFFAVIRKKFIEQEKLRQELYSMVPSNTGAREWIHVFNTDLEVEAGETDEIVM
jgi:hypothetical protein